ncbi:uncharacterized protein [Manis javanica]|uniref:uncharacterized protein n=1 Tax=Manis javanica TaxID=9974 RepID=UPI003C6D1C66
MGPVVGEWQCVSGAAVPGDREQIVCTGSTRGAHHHSDQTAQVTACVHQRQWHQRSPGEVRTGGVRAHLQRCQREQPQSQQPSRIPARCTATWARPNDHCRHTAARQGGGRYCRGAYLAFKDSDKLTLGQKLTVVAPHALESVIRQPPERWMSNARMTHYQTLLLNRDRVEFAPPAILNPATLLPELGKEVLHTCQEILAEETGTRQDLQDQPLRGTGLLTWYTDGSSYIMDSKRMAGAAVVDDDRVVWASGLPTGTSAQRAELIALTQALRMAEVNVSKNQAISGKRLRGDRPGAYWEVDFTEIKPAKYRYKYLLVFLDTFSGWTEAFPTKTETAQTVSKKILEEIFPRFGIPKVDLPLRSLLLGRSLSSPAAPLST